MRLFCALSALLFLSLAQGAEQRKLIVIDIDGLDARYLRDADKLHLKIPVLRKLMKQGVVAEGVVGVFPSTSEAAAEAIVTGVAPALMPKPKTLWQAAMEAHRKTALLYWPATAASDADFVCPQFWEGRPAVDPDFEPIAQRCTPGFPQRIASAFPTFTKVHWSDASALQALRYLLQSEQPDLTMVHLADLEGEENETGALSIYSREVLESDDDLIGQALLKRPPHSLVAIVSDHGFDTENYMVRAKLLVGSKAVEVKHGLIGATDAKAAAALRKFIGNKKMGIAREVPIAEVRRVVPDAAGWVAAFTTMPGFVGSNESTGKPVGPGNHKGVSSEWPLRPDYRSAFILSGDGVKPGKVGEISMLDIAPTFARVLDVPLPAAKGNSLWPKVSAAK
jgi:predicted AlkP superfamily pyrophosphatase or phosphodiesterase